MAAQATRLAPAQDATLVPVPVAGPQQARWFRALDHARLAMTRKPTYSIATDTYRVYSARADAEYTVEPVSVNGAITYRCSCVAGQSCTPCWHAAGIAALPAEVARRRDHTAEPTPLLAHRCGNCGDARVAVAGDWCSGCLNLKHGAEAQAPTPIRARPTCPRCGLVGIDPLHDLFCN